MALSSVFALVALPKPNCACACKKRERLFPGEIADRRRTITSSAKKWQSNQSSPGDLLSLYRISQKFTEHFRRLRLFTELFPSQRGIKSHFGKRADAHCPKIAPEICGNQPVHARGFLFAEQSQRDAQPVMNVALVRQQMPGLAEIFRRSERIFKMACRARIAVMRERLATERELCADVRRAPLLRRLPRAGICVAPKFVCASLWRPTWLR